MENNKRSRIITTTRIIGVAEHVGGCYRLKPLSDESSEILLMEEYLDQKINVLGNFLKYLKIF